MPCCHLETHLRHIFPELVRKKEKESVNFRPTVRILSNHTIRSPHSTHEKLKPKEGLRVKQLVSKVLELEMPASDFQAKEDIQPPGLYVGFI